MLKATCTQRIVIAAPPEVVWDYTQDFRHRPEWDPAVAVAEVVQEAPVWRLALATRMIFPEVQIAEPQSAELTDPHSRVAQPGHDHPVASCSDRIEHRLTRPIRKCAGKLPRHGSVG